MSHPTGPRSLTAPAHVFPTPEMPSAARGQRVILSLSLEEQDFSKQQPADPAGVPSGLPASCTVLFPDTSLYGLLCALFSTSSLLLNETGPNEAEPTPREAHSSLFDPCLTPELPRDTGQVAVWLSPLVCTLAFLRAVFLRSSPDDL